MSAWRGGCALAPANCNNINKKSKNVLITRSLSLACCNLLAGVWKKKRHTAQTVETLLCQFVLLQLHFMHSPWSVNSQSVETHLLDFCLHLSLQRREKKPPPWVTFYLSVCCSVGQVSSSSVPSLGGTGSCFLNRLPWRTWGGTASSLLIWRAQLIWLWNRGQHGKIHPEETKH